LLLYALDSKETEESLKRDPDVRLIPSTIEKIVIPKLTCKTDIKIIFYNVYNNYIYIK